MRLRTRIGLVLILVLVLLAAGTWIYNSSTGSALDRFKAALRAKGEKLLFTELAIPPSTNADEVAFRQLHVTNELLEPKLVPALMSYTAPGQARVAWKGELRLDSGTGAWAELEAQVEKAEPSMKPLRQALEHPAPDSGWIYTDDFTNNINGPDSNFKINRTIAHTLMSAGACALRRGDIDGAFSNLHALASLARVGKSEVPLVWGMLRVGTANLGLSATWEALQAPGWDEARLARLQRDWEQFDAPAAVERGIQGERARAESGMTMIRHSSSAGFTRIVARFLNPSGPGRGGSDPNYLTLAGSGIIGTYYRLFGANADELAQLEYFDKVLSGVRMMEANRGWAEARVVETNAAAELDLKIKKDHAGRLVLSKLLMPDLPRCVETSVRCETLRRLTITALAIKRYEIKHGAAPADLRALAPEFLTDVPLDPMSGKPLCYQLKADGTFVLYSTGADGVDNGGDATPTAGAKFGLWEGKDAVWPSAAEVDPKFQNAQAKLK